MSDSNTRKAGNRNDKTPSNPPADEPATANDANQPGVTDDGPIEQNPTRPVRSGEGFEDMYLDERNDVLTVINELEDQLDAYQEQRETLEAELSRRTSELHAANQKIQEFEWQVVTSQTRIESLEQSRQDSAVLEEELADATRRMQRANEQLLVAQKESMRLTGELKSANKQLEDFWAVRKERDGLKSDLKSIAGKYEGLERDHREALDAQAIAQDKLRDSEITIDELRKAKATIEMSLRNAEDRGSELTRVQAQLEEKIESLRTDKKAIQAHVAHLERENARLAEQRQFYETELMSLRNQNRSAENALASVKRAFSEVRVALSETKSRARRRSTGSRSHILDEARGMVLDAAIAETNTVDTTTILTGDHGEDTDVTPVSAVSSTEDITDETSTE